MKAGFLQKLIEKVDRVEPGEVQGYLVRLMQERGFLEKVFDALQEGVIVIDGDGVITYVNQAASRLFGIDRDQSVGEDLTETMPGLDWQTLTATRKVVSRDMEVYYPENRFLNFYLAPIEDEEVLLGYVMLVRDVTEQHEMQAQKIESETLNVLTMLAAGVAHEIGNPLNSLNIHLQLAERKLRRAPADIRQELSELIATSRGEIQRLDLIIGQFLSAIRPTTPVTEPSDINALIRDSIRFLEPEIEDRKVQVRLDLTESMPLLNLDRDQVKQAFYNLIRNANQAIGTDGLLQIRSVADDFSVYVEFTDNGPGISPDTMAKLFEPFHTTRKSGSGLGLLIVRRILREHGGEIELESEEGVGTRVTCILPRTEKQMRLLSMKAQSTDAEPESKDDKVIDI